MCPMIMRGEQDRADDRSDAEGQQHAGRGLDKVLGCGVVEGVRHGDGVERLREHTDQKRPSAPRSGKAPGEKTTITSDAAAVPSRGRQEQAAGPCGPKDARPAIGRSCRRR